MQKRSTDYLSNHTKFKLTSDEFQLLMRQEHQGEYPLHYQNAKEIIEEGLKLIYENDKIMVSSFFGEKNSNTGYYDTYITFTI